MRSCLSPIRSTSGGATRVNPNDIAIANMVWCKGGQGRVVHCAVAVQSYCNPTC